MAIAIQIQTGDEIALANTRGGVAIDEAGGRHGVNEKPGVEERASSRAGLRVYIVFPGGVGAGDCARAKRCCLEDSGAVKNCEAAPA